MQMSNESPKDVYFRMLARLHKTRSSVIDGTLVLSVMLEEEVIVEALRSRNVNIDGLRQEISGILEQRPDRMSWEDSLRNSPAELEAILLNGIAILERARSEYLSAGELINAFDSPPNNSASVLLRKYSSASF